MPEKESLKNSIEHWRNQRNNAQKLWSFVHHLSLFGSIVSSVAAGAILQASDNQTLPSILTSISAVLTGIAVSGGFERKWRSNRLSRSTADRLLIDIDCDDADIKLIRDQYKSAIEKHDAEVVGGSNTDKS
ncbi:MAG: hypothetical protein Q7U98_11555 [Methylicorpusculum sp.]|uniref:hypothetical protein n=1 Tax=Methylicorpusculum sp. TaxID=2713644 RepID=UPI002723B050|nr:hypothetical protein [Methylicorpusculum sp.]MDO8939783.1 hypothetical protein [Methylicorpusculum sp.]MDP2180779.1 hypothetical protein [Methylicorpusculum sp.]MDP2201414.1 hypothetical protein [Methylicorpusculum sp.]MDZ4153723.1 hypothetical protein [Methylicorpusculum sp.]